MEEIKDQVTEDKVETAVEDKPKRTRRTKAEIEAARTKEIEDVTEDIEDTKSVDTEDVIPVIDIGFIDEDVKETKYKPHVTYHNFAPNEKVFVADFCQNRDTQGYTKIVNSFRFSPKAGEIERVIITDKVQYKLKNRAGSLFDEEDVCHTEEEAEKLCEIKNRR